MSAIFGIINKKGDAIDTAMATKMQTSLLHRAVDGKNMLIPGEMMFGHHKLIVHRRQTEEQQPFEHDDCIITSDARIDNIKELGEELELPFSLNITDSFIILKAYKKWGNDCVKHLEGEFTFAIWDKLTKTFYGASDHIGFRTFYYYENNEIFAFASEIRAIESIKTEPLKINEEIFLNYYTNIHHPITYDKNIKEVPCAHYLLLKKNSQLKIERYWKAGPKNKYKFKHSHEWYDCLLKLVTKKIECQIDSNYPIGIILSGGLDSSFVTAIACKLLKEKTRKLIAFSSVLPEDYNGPDKDERFYIEKLKEHYDNLEVHYVTIPDEIGPYSNLNEAFNRVELPVNLFHYVESALFQSAEKYGVRTLLSGFGGDMAVSYNGNGVIYQNLSNFKILKAFELLIKRYKIEHFSLISMIKMEILGHNILYRKIRDFIKKEDYSYYPLKKALARKIIKGNATPGKKSLFKNKINNSELSGYLLRLRKHGIAFNIEFLSPLLDKDVTELFFDIPDELHLLNGVKRSLIKETMKIMVPPEIIMRNDKLSFSPDYNRRIATITDKNLEYLFKNKEQIEKVTEIDFELLKKAISKISHSEIKTEWQFNKHLAFIPDVILSAEFYLWLIRKKKL